MNRALRRTAAVVPALVAGLLAVPPAPAHADSAEVVASTAFVAGQSSEAPTGWTSADVPGGDLVVAGTITQPTTFGATEVDPSSAGTATGFVMRVSADGSQVRWAHQTGYYGTRPTAVVVSGGVLVTLEVGGGGSSAFSGHLVAWDLSSGDYRWHSGNVLGSTPYCLEPAMAVAPDGSLVVTASTSGGIYTGTGWDYSTSGYCRSLVESLDATSGAARWVRILSASSGDGIQTQRVAVSPDGTAVVAGYYGGTFTFGSQTLGQTGSGSTRGFVGAFGADGTPRWVAPYAVSALPHEIAAFTTTEDEVLVFGDRTTGWTASSPSRYLSAFDLVDGHSLWQDALPVGFGIVGAEEVGAVAAGPDGTIVLAAPFTGTRDVAGHVVSGADGTWDTAIVGVSKADGTVLYADELGGPGNDQVRALSVTDGQARLTGLFDVPVTDGTSVQRAAVATYSLPTGLRGLHVAGSGEVGQSLPLTVDSLSGNPVTLSSSGPCALDRSSGFAATVSLAHVGTCGITATQVSQGIQQSLTASIDITPVRVFVTWAPAALTYPAALGSAQLGARFTDAQGADLPGTVTYSASAGTVLPAGSRDVTATFHSSSTDVSDATATRTVSVAQGTPQLSWPGTGSLVYGTPLPAAAVASGYSGSIAGALGYDTHGPGEVLDAGTYSLVVRFTSTDPNYRSTSTTVTVTVQRAVTGLTTDFDATTGTLVGTLTDTTHHVPLAGRPLRFVVGSTSCTGYTDLTGRATCSIADVNALSLATKGFTVYYSGEGNYAPSSRHRDPLISTPL